MASDVIEISSLTSDAELTRIHTQSNLPFNHTSRRTKSGFLVDGPLLRAYIPTPPGKKAFDSWIYKHGEGITHKIDGKRLWLCRLCYDQKPPILLLKPALSTTTPIRHLVKEHSFKEDGTKVTKNKRKAKDQEDLPAVVQRQIEAQTAVFDLNDWKSVYLVWAIADDVSLSKTASKRLRRLLSYRSPHIKPVIPKSRTTTCRWIIKAFKELRPIIIHDLAVAKSRITISFDAWKSDNQLDLLGITAHYVDEQYQVKNVLLAWRKKGPIGKLHNIVIHARSTPKRREYFKSKQKEAQPTERLYQLVVNGGIRWNSTCEMLERAFKLKDAIELYQQQFRVDEDEPLEEDLLTSDDWLELRDLLTSYCHSRRCPSAYRVMVRSATMALYGNH
jgi:hypothetical protein